MRRKKEGETRQEVSLGIPAHWLRWDSIRPQRLRWLWYGRIAVGSLTIIEGRKGQGKSTLCAALAAHATGAKSLPRQPAVKPAGGVLWLGQEDGAATVSRPRIEAAGGKVARVFSPPVDPETHMPLRVTFPGDVPELTGIVRAHRVKLLVIDPLSSCVSRDCNLSFEQDIRHALTPLALMAEATELAVVIVRHIRKATNGPALDAGLGGVGIGNMARTILRLDTDPDDADRHLVSVVANNSGKVEPTLSYRLQDCGGVPVIEWAGVSDLTADQIAEASGDTGERDARGDARLFLRVELDKSEKPVKDLEARADLAGISRGTLRRAKKDLGVTSHPKGSNEDRYFVWRAPKGGFKDGGNGRVGAQIAH